MKTNSKFIAIGLFLLALFFAAPALAQTKLLKRTTYKTERIDFGVGGTISILGAPQGSIAIEGWQKNEVEITAEIEVQAETEADLAELAAVNNFTYDVTIGRLGIISVGSFSKEYLKKNAKNFPKKLLTMPVRIDYKIKVPIFSDLEIDGGRGDFDLSKVEGAMRINFLDTSARLKFSGGAVLATFGKGTINLEVLSRSWRGQGADIQLGAGAMNITLPADINADLDASILRTGKIDLAFTTFKPRDRTKFTDKFIAAKAGNGGAKLAFTVGDGDLGIAPGGK